MRLVFLKKIIFRYGAWALLALISLNAHAVNTWVYQQENDRLSNKSFSFARSPMPRTDLYDDLRLDIACKDKKLQVIVEADALIASQGSAFEVEIQIDKQTPLKVIMHTFPDSKRKGFTDAQARQVSDALLSGQTVFIRVNTMIRRVLSGEMPLTDAIVPIKQVYADCAVSAESTPSSVDYSLAQFVADFNLLSVEKQRVVLEGLHGVMSSIK